MWLAPKNGVVAVVNDVACHLLGFGCEELVGKNIDDIVASSGAADLGTAVDQEDFEVGKQAGSGGTAAKVVVSGKVVRLNRRSICFGGFSLLKMRKLDGDTVYRHHK